MKRSVIQFFRGASDNLPQLLPGEPAFTLDSQKLYVGGLSGNVEINTDSSGGSGGSGVQFNGGSVGSPIEVISNIWPQIIGAASENEVVAYAWKSGADIIWTIHKDEEDTLHLIDYQNNASYMTFRIPSSGDEYVRVHKRLGVGGSPASSLHNYGGFYNEGSAVFTGRLSNMPQISIGTEEATSALHVSGGILGTSALLASGLTLGDQLIISQPTNPDALIARRNGSAGFTFEGYGTFAGGFISLNAARGTELSPSTLSFGDRLGSITFSAWDSDYGQFSAGGTIIGRAMSNWGTDDYATQIEFYRVRSGTDSLNKALIIGDTIEVNGDNADVDFRVEGTGEENLIFADAGNDRVGIGTGSPDVTLHVKGDAGVLVLEGDTSARMDMIDLESATGYQRFALALDAEALNVSLRNDDGTFKQTFINFDTNGGGYYTDIKHGTLINSSQGNQNTIISGAAEANLVHVDAANDRVHVVEDRWGWSRAVAALQAMPGIRGIWPTFLNGSAEMVDVSGNGNHLTRVNGGVVDNALGVLPPVIFFAANTHYFSIADNADNSFTGTESFVRSSQNLRGFTLGVWVRPWNMGANQTLMRKWSGGTDRSYWFYINAADGLTLALSADGSTQLFTGGHNGDMSQGTWYFAAVRYDAEAQETTFWLDDATVTNTTNVPASVYDGTGDFTIGAPGQSPVSGRISLAFTAGVAVPDDVIDAYYRLTAPMFGKSPV